jgi:hypothetical protein
MATVRGGLRDTVVKEFPLPRLQLADFTPTHARMYATSENDWCGK